MTIYLVPKTYNGVSINNVNGIDSMRFELPIPQSISGILPVAGGSLFDFNYGGGALLRPKPFKISMTARGTTAANLNTTFNGFFGLPPTGFYGETHTFVADVHGTATTKSCTAELTDVSFVQDVKWYDTAKAFIIGLSVTFTPVDLFS